MNQLFGIVFLATLLAGCGGGGGDGAAPEPPTQNTAPTILVNGSQQSGTFAVSMAENSSDVATVTATDAESTPSLSLSGADAALFALNGDQLSFAAAPDFEMPMSAAGSNVYSVTVVASDGGADTNQNIEVTITNLFELAGRVTDGPVAGATVFVDLNCNKVADAGEPTAVTDADGYFEITADIEAQAGCDPKVIALGGTDTATGEDNTNAITADVPENEANVNVTPLSTVLAAAETPEAKQEVLDALGLGDSTPEEVLTSDSWAEAEADDAQAQAIQRVNTQLATITSTASSASPGGDALDVAEAVAAAIVDSVEDAAGGEVDLADSDTIGEVLTDSTDGVDEAVIDAVAEAVAAVNTVAGDESLNPTSDTAIAVATVAQTTVQESVADVVSGETTVEEFEEETDPGTILDDVPTEPDAPDLDGDGLADSVDPDDDGDGVNDNVDPFPQDGTETVDTDGDGTGDNADTDDDADGTLDENDAFPLDPAEDTDTDSDGTGNNADTDDDNDSVADGDDAFPLDNSESVDTDMDGIGNNADTDDDNDGVPDSADLDPLDPMVGGNGFKVEHVGLHDFVDGDWEEGHVVYSLDPSVSGSTVMIAPQNSLDITNLEELADNMTMAGASPQLFFIFSAIPNEGESGTLTLTATITDGMDANRDAGERSVMTSLDVEWSSTGDMVTATAVAQTSTVVFIDGSGVAIEKTYTNGDSDSVQFGHVFDGVWSLDMKIGEFLAQVGDDIDFGGFLSEGNYFMDVQIEQSGLPNLYYRTDMVDSVQGSFTVADVSLEVTNGFNVASVDVMDPNDMPMPDDMLGRAETMMLGESLQVLFTESFDLATLIAMADGDLSVAESPQLTFEIWQVPDAGGSGTFEFEISVTDGTDATRDAGERQVTGTIEVDWSSDGTNVMLTVPAQEAPVSITTQDGTGVETTFDNVDSDMVTVSDMSPEYPALLNIRLLEFYSANENYDLTDAFVAGDYFLKVEITDEEGDSNLHYEGLPMDSVEAVVPVE